MRAGGVPTDAQAWKDRRRQPDPNRHVSLLMLRFTLCLIGGLRTALIGLAVAMSAERFPFCATSAAVSLKGTSLALLLENSPLWLQIRVREISRYSSCAGQSYVVASLCAAHQAVRSPPCSVRTEPNRSPTAPKGDPFRPLRFWDRQRIPS